MVFVFARCMHFIAQPFFVNRSLQAFQVFSQLTSMRSFIFSCCVALCRSEWPVPFVVGPETVPNVEVSLDAPSKPLPDVSDEVGKLEAEREAKQEIHKHKMVRAFNAELASARFRIAAVFDRTEHGFAGRPRRSQHKSAQEPGHAVEPAMSFLKSSIVKVVVAPEKHAPEAAHAAIAGIEDSRVADEDAWFEAAVADMSRLTDMVVATVESETSAVVTASSLPGSLSRSANFLQLGDIARDRGIVDTTEANVRVVGASVPYPTIQSLVDSLEARRDISEDLGKAQVLTMYLKLLEFENMLVDSGLKAFVLKSKAAK